jgi:hypothetical protein
MLPVLEGKNVNRGRKSGKCERKRKKEKGNELRRIKQMQKGQKKP